LKYQEMENEKMINYKYGEKILWLSKDDIKKWINFSHGDRMQGMVNIINFCELFLSKDLVIVNFWKKSKDRHPCMTRLFLWMFIRWIKEREKPFYHFTYNCECHLTIFKTWRDKKF
jgi:hypothetical protein